MALPFFAIENLYSASPKKKYEELQQAFVDEAWDNSAVVHTVKEQHGIGSHHFKDIEVWVDTPVSDVTSGLKDSNDFLKFIFKDIKHEVTRGLMYWFDNNYWIVNNYSPYSGLVQQCGVRRCNNRLKIVDPTNGKVQSIPCCVDYDMASPSTQINRYVITPNNHAVVIVQGNDLTARLFTINSRFILSGRPFKLYAFQNAVEQNELKQQSTLLYLELYLDEIRDGDDLINSVANNGTYNYEIQINSNNVDTAVGANGKLYASVMLNGEEVERKVRWTTNDSSIIEVDENGCYMVKKATDAYITVTACLDGNEDVKDSIELKIKTEPVEETYLTILPFITKIRQFETLTINPVVYYGGIRYDSFDDMKIEVVNDTDNYVVLSGKELTALKISPQPITIKITVENTAPAFEITQYYDIEILSMLG